MARLFQKVAWQACLCTPLLLAACGGGGDGNAQVGASATSVTGSPATPTATNDPSANASSLVVATGNESTLATASFASTGADAYTVSVDGKSYALDLSGSTVVVTSPGGTTGYDGAFVMLCGAGKAEAVVSNPKASSVTPGTLADIKGKRFVYVENCAEDVTVVSTFNPEGSVTHTKDGVIPASEISAYLSTGGAQEGADRWYGHIYKVVINGATQYVIVESSIKGGVKGIVLLVEQAP